MTSFKKAFEYKSLPIKFPKGDDDRETFDKLLNGVGHDGWDLVSVTPTLQGEHALYACAVFKREIRVPV